MRLKYLKIVGYRGFGNFEIAGSEVTPLIIIAGQNGTGKSTILEVVGYLLTKNDSSIFDSKFRLGITSTKAEWKVSVEISNGEIEYLANAIAEKDPAHYQRERDLANHIKKDLKIIDKNKYEFAIQLVIPKLGEAVWIFEGIQSSESIPDWFQYLKQNDIGLVKYVRPFDNIGEMGAAHLGYSSYDPEMANMARSEINLANRNVRSNLDIGNALKKIVVNDMWKFFTQNHGEYLELNKLLTTINRIIAPIEIFHDLNAAKRGQISFKFRSEKIAVPYPINYASSGEKQVVALALLMASWSQQDFKPILLIDEPEIHLHPEYINKLAQLFNEIFDSTQKSSCLVATHSSDFITENPKNVYQITPDSSKIQKVEKLADRDSLLKSMGKKLDLKYLAPKIIFVEGLDGTKTHLEDAEIYQKMIDPQREDIIFVSAGGKSKVKSINEYFQLLLSRISQQGADLGIYCIIDNDNETTVVNSTSIFVTPFKCVENLFLFNVNAIYKAVDFFGSNITPHELQGIYNLVVKGENIIEIDGKSVFQQLFKEIKLRIGDSSLSKKSFQWKILEFLEEENIPSEVNTFFEKIRNL